MRISTVKQLVGLLGKHPGYLLRRRQYLFVLSHMRSRSSLLCHILGSNPEICGYTEVQQHYRTGLDLLRLRYRVYLTTEGRTSCRYILDKLLHDYDVSRRVLEDPSVTCLFFLRRPAETIQSILKMERSSGSANAWATPEGAVNYYVARLAQLEKFARNRPVGCDLFLRSEALLTESELALSRLSKGLHLKTPLAPEYRTFKYTGQPRHGDPSAHIKSGRIVSVPLSDQVSLSGALLDRAQASYSRCCALLVDHCHSCLASDAI